MRGEACEHAILPKPTHDGVLKKGWSDEGCTFFAFVLCTLQDDTSYCCKPTSQAASRATAHILELLAFAQDMKRQTWDPCTGLRFRSKLKLCLSSPRDLFLVPQADEATR